MKQYKKRPVVIEAVQLTEDSFSSGHPNPLHIKGVDYDPINKCAYIDTLEGRMTAQLGDWIIKGVKGELYSCKDDIFKMTYESVNCERYRAYLPTDNPPALCEADCIGHGYQECGGCYYLKIDESIMERRNDGTLRDSESE